jgi:hypothetical protein
LLVAYRVASEPPAVTPHNIQARIPVANLVALFEAVNDYRSYPITVA